MKRLFAILAIVLASGQAMAGGLSNPIIPADPATPSTSVRNLDFYAGGGIGAATLDNDYTLDFRGDVEDVALDLDGKAYSAFVGVRYTFASGIVIGGEIQHTEINGSDTVDCHGVCQLCSASQGGILDATLTAGYTTGRLTLYGLAGVAQTTGGFDLANPNGGSIAGGGYDTDGTVYGAGIEYAINDRWSIGAEYNAFDFGGSDGKTRFYDVSSETDLETIHVRAIFTF